MVGNKRLKDAGKRFRHCAVVGPSFGEPSMLNLSIRMDDGDVDFS
jgi:hypothetical protein